MPNSGAIVENRTMLARIGQGPGVQGLWQGRWKLSFEEDQYEFTPTVILAYIDKQTAALAMAQWRGEGPGGPASAESSSFDMDARAIDKYTVEYKGRFTGEIVRVTTQSNDDADYSSSDTSHHPARYSQNMPTCPLTGWPDWYENFRNVNRKPGAPAPKAMAGYRESPMVPKAGAKTSKRKPTWIYP